MGDRRAGRFSWPLGAALCVLVLIPIVAAVPEVSASGTTAVLTIGALVLQALALLTSRRFPGPTLVACTAVDLVLVWLHPGNSTASLGVALAVFAMRRFSTRRTALTWIAPLALASAIVVATVGPGEEIDGAWSLPLAVGRVVLVFVLPVVIAEVVLGRRQLIDALRERAEAAEREREATARHAIQQQRTSIARELHDIAAHHLTGIIVSAQAARRLAAVDPDRQRGYLDTVQADARTALENIRLTVGLLRSDERAEAHPAPSMADLAEIVAEANARGCSVELVERGDPRSVGPVAGIIAVRGVQEALANTVKHAPGSSVTVAVSWEHDRLQIDVEDTGALEPRVSLPPSGYGLIGLEERLALVGGHLRAARSGAGWRTSFEIPLEATSDQGASG